MTRNHQDNTENVVTTNPFKAEPWFAPSSICRVMRTLVHSYGPSSLAMYVPTDPVVYIDKVVQLCTQQRHPSSSSSSPANSELEHTDESGDEERQQQAQPQQQKEEPPIWRSLFILIPMRLGVDKTNPIYFQTILACLRMPQSVGIIGGKPKQSYWFVGYQDEHLIYLDPHIVQESLQANALFSDESYHCSVPQKIHISEVDPSLAVGFYCHTKEEFENFCSAIVEMSKTSAPIFTIEQEEPVYDSEED